MKTPSNARKLVLSKESIRTLSTEALKDVAGGMRPRTEQTWCACKP